MTSSLKTILPLWSETAFSPRPASTIIKAEGVPVSLPKKLKSSLPEKGLSMNSALPPAAVTALLTRSIMAGSLYWSA